MPAQTSSKPFTDQQKGLLRAFAGTVTHYFGGWDTIFKGVSDPRNPSLSLYPLVSLLVTGVLLFICRLGARRGVKDKLRDNQPSQAKFMAWLGVANVPHGDTLNYCYQRLQVGEVQEVVCQSVETLIRKKVLYRYRLLGVHFLVVIDGTGMLRFRERHCAQCLTKKLTNGQTVYYHPILEAKLVTPNGFAFSLMTEFIENTDLSADKQDCELRAFYRLTARLKRRFPRLPICLLLDGLYAGGPTFRLCETYDWKYFIVLREEDLPNLQRSFAVAIAQLPEQSKSVNWQTVNDRQRSEHVHQIYRWAEGLAYTDTQGHAHSLGVLECQEDAIDTQGKTRALHYKWITNFTLTHRNVDRLANDGARLRWKIENEGFNVQKNSELRLEHAYSHDPTASKVFYLLLQLAYTLFQLLQHGSLLQQVFPDRLRTAKNLAFRLLEAWRNCCVSAEEWRTLVGGAFQIRLNNTS